MSATTVPHRGAETEPRNSTQRTQTQDKRTNHAGNFVSSTSLRNTAPGKNPANLPLKAKQVIKKHQTGSRLRQPSALKPFTAKQHATDLESRLESILTVAAGGLNTLMGNLVARQNSKSIRDEELSQHTATLGAISEELKNQLKILGKSSKLANQQDHKSFDMSYRRILALWKEYQRVSASVVQRARIWKEASARSISEKDDSSDSSSMSNSSTASRGSADRVTGKHYR